MAYFLKQTENEKGTYLYIYESYYDSERKNDAHRSYRSIGYIHELIEQGIENPVSYYQSEVDKLNKQHKAERTDNEVKVASDMSPEKMIEYYAVKNVNDFLQTKKYIDIMQAATDFNFSIFDMLSSLVYSRILKSNTKTHDIVIPKSLDKADFSLSQLNSGVEYIGSEYEKIIEIYNNQVNQKYKFDTSNSYFICTHFYFGGRYKEDFSKLLDENSHQSLFGIGLLLDANQIPVGMQIYPCNESEKPVIKNVIIGLKNRNGISGRTIRISDEGLICGNNINDILENDDGYIISEDVKTLPKNEKNWVLLSDGYREVKDKGDKLLYRFKSYTDIFEYDVDEPDGQIMKLIVKEKRLVTYSPALAKKEIHKINELVERAYNLMSLGAQKSEYGECAKYVKFISGVGETKKVAVSIDRNAIDEAKSLAGYSMIVTTETSMLEKEIYNAYQNLHDIKESFCTMKTELDSQSEGLQKTNTIIGSFLVCYLATLLSRLF